MKTEHTYSKLDCNVCTNGRLIYMHYMQDNILFLECEECMTGYWDIEKPGDTFRAEEFNKPVQIAPIHMIPKDH